MTISTDRKILRTTINMKTQLFGTALIAVLISTAADMHAAGSYTLETAIFVFRNSEVRESGISDDAATGGGAGKIFRSPAVVRFGGVSLSLDGTRFSWGSGGNPPDRFTRIETPNASILPGRPVALLFTSPVQYLERASDGSLKVREIPGDSPDAPHWRISFKLEPEANEDGQLSVDCEVDVASVSSRENLPGVTLPVGKPVLARFNETLQLKLSLEEWSAFVVSASDKSDYTMLTLIKVRPGQAPPQAGGPDRPMTAHEFAVFATYYYQSPQPERIARAIESLGSNRFLDNKGNQYPVQHHQRVQTTVGFFAEVFAANPERVTEWRKLIDRRGQNSDVRELLHKALELSPTSATLELASNKADWADNTFVSWGAFLASGDPVYLRQMVDRFELVYDSDFATYVVGADAIGVLAFHSPHHPLVRLTLVAAQEDASPRTRELIDDILTNDFAAVRRKIIRDMTPHRSSELWPNSMNSFPGGIPPPPPSRFEQN